MVPHASSSNALPAEYLECNWPLRFDINPSPYIAQHNCTAGTVLQIAKKICCALHASPAKSQTLPVSML